MPAQRKAQVAIEFMLLTAMSLFFLCAILVILSTVSSKNMDAQRTEAFEDIGTTIKNELALTSEMENGYHRLIYLPKKASGKEYTIEIQESITGMSYVVLKCENLERYFAVPETSGTISPGRNMIVKQTDNITVEYLG